MFMDSNAIIRCECPKCSTNSIQPQSKTPISPFARMEKPTLKLI
jgi:hypothetical protein